MPRKSANTSIVFSIFRIHCYCVPAFSACISIASGGQESLISELWRALEKERALESSGEKERKKERKKELWRALESSGSPKVMYSSTVYVHFYVVSALFVFHATLAVRIPTVFRHCVRTFLLLSSTFCMHFYVLHSMRAFHSSFLKEMESWRAGEWNCLNFIIFKRNGELESWRAVELYSYCIPT